MKSRRREKRRRGGLKDALVDAAVELLSRNEGFGLREVARRAGVTHGAPYRHFADKTALLAAVAQDGFVKLATLLDEGPAPSDPLLRLRELGRAYVRFAVAQPAHYRP